MTCKKCGNELKVGVDYCGKEICKKCYYHDYITKRWAKDEDYRKAQRARIDKWQKENPDKVKEIANKCYKKKNRVITNKDIKGWIKILENKTK